MKTSTILSILLLSSTLMAQEVHNKFDVGFSNIKVFNDAKVPALSFKIKPNKSKKLDVMLAYTNKFLIMQRLQLPTETKNPEQDKLYVSLTYRF